MPVVLLERIPLPSLRTYTGISVLLVALAVYFAHSAVNNLADPNTQYEDATAISDSSEVSNQRTWKEHFQPSKNVSLTTEEYLMEFSAVILQEPWCVWVMINMAYCCLILYGKLIQKVVFGALRVSEQQHLKDKFWNFIFYKFIFIFGVMNVQTMEEIVLWCAWFTALGFLHLLSQLSKDRFEYSASLTVVLVCYLPQMVAGQDCCRDQSRLVRNVITKEMLPLYAELEVSMPSNCPWNLHSDLYGIHEDNKLAESANRWVCRFCGKAFYDERYLDLHFVNRHADYLRQGPSATCLAHFCDIFRCEVIRKRHKPEYWDLALCKEIELQQRRHKCKELVESCIPQLPHQSNTQLNATLEEKICGYLTCEKYWHLYEEESQPMAIAAYLMGSVILSVCLFIYYYLTCTHFYTEDSLFDPVHGLNPVYQKRPFFIAGGQSINRRKHRTH